MVAAMASHRCSMASSNPSTSSKAVPAAAALVLQRAARDVLVSLELLFAS